MVSFLDMTLLDFVPQPSMGSSRFPLDWKLPWGLRSSLSTLLGLKRASIGPGSHLGIEEAVLASNSTSVDLNSSIAVGRFSSDTTEAVESLSFWFLRKAGTCLGNIVVRKAMVISSFGAAGVAIATIFM